MESAAHARVAQEHRLPFLALRAIIDTASTDIPANVLKALDSQGRINIWKLFISVYLTPADWIKIVLLGIQFYAAQRTLRSTKELALDSSRF